MALTDNPYLPLYVKDWLTSNELKLCSIASHGLLINIMCLMHRQNDYGKILLHQNHKQNQSKTKNFASMLSKLLPFEKTEIENLLNELIQNNRLKIKEDYLICERMINDANLSKIRAKAGLKGSINKKGFAEAKAEANTGIGIGNESGNGIEFKIPKKEEVKSYFEMYLPRIADQWEQFYNYYSAFNWEIRGSKISKWKYLAKNWDINKAIKEIEKIQKTTSKTQDSYDRAESVKKEMLNLLKNKNEQILSLES